MDVFPPPLLAALFVPEELAEVGVEPDGVPLAPVALLVLVVVELVFVPDALDVLAIAVCWLGVAALESGGVYGKPGGV